MSSFDLIDELLPAVQLKEFLTCLLILRVFLSRGNAEGLLYAAQSKLNPDHF